MRYEHLPKSPKSPEAGIDTEAVAVKAYVNAAIFLIATSVFAHKCSRLGDALVDIYEQQTGGVSAPNQSEDTPE